MADTALRAVRKEGKKPSTTFEVHHWPTDSEFKGYVCSSSCDHDDSRLLSEDWEHREDRKQISRRLVNNRGLARGRVLYYVSRPPLMMKRRSLQRDAVALLSLRSQAVLIYRVCFRRGLVRMEQGWAFSTFCYAGARLAGQLNRPVQVLLEPRMDADRLAKSLMGFRRARKNDLARDHREMAGVWLERGP
jgi:hypothetical protein